MARKASQGSIPYTYARVSAMRAKLIDRHDYDKLLKMDLNSLARYLQDSEYKDSITKLSTRYSGVDLIDQALTMNMVKTFDKLRKISPARAVPVIDLYLGRWDFQNLKVVLRGIYSNVPEEEVSDLIEAVGNFSKEHFIQLFRTSSVKDALHNSKIVTEKDFGDAYDSFKQSGKLIELENLLDKICFMRQVKGTKLYGTYGLEFHKFLLRDIDLTNIKNLMRFKREGLDPQTIMKYMIVPGGKIREAELEKLSKSENLQSLLENLKHTFFSRYIRFSSKIPISEIEITLQNQIIRASTSRMQKNPMSIVAVLTYMMKKLIEVRNIRTIAKSKHLGIDMDFVEDKLLIK